MTQLFTDHGPFRFKLHALGLTDDTHFNCHHWSVEHSHTRKPSSARLLWTDARKDRRIVRAAVPARTVPREEIRAHVAPALSLRTIGNRLLEVGLRSRVPLARLPLTPKHRQARMLWFRDRVYWRLKRSSVVFSDKYRFCLNASDGSTRVRRRPGERHLLECIHPRHTGPTSVFLVWGS